MFGSAVMRQRALPPRSVAITTKTGVSRKRRRPVPVVSVPTSESLNALHSRSKAEGRALGTRIVCESKLRYFLEFCATVSLDPDTFGQPGLLSLQEEEHLLGLLAVFVGECAIMRCHRPPAYSFSGL